MSGVYRIFHPEKTGKVYGRRAGVMRPQPHTKEEINERVENRKARIERAKALGWKPPSNEQYHLKKAVWTDVVRARQRAKNNPALDPDETFLDRDSEE